jgi:hypothetical protein
MMARGAGPSTSFVEWARGPRGADGSVVLRTQPAYGGPGTPHLAVAEGG